MRLKWPLLLGLVALLLGAPAAHARSPFHVVGPGSVTTDGERYAVLSDTDGIPYRVIDDQAGRSFPVPPAPADCAPWSVQVADGYLLWDVCTTVVAGVPSSRPQLQDLETGELGQVPGWDTYVSWFVAGPGMGWTGDGPWPDDFGSRWLRARIDCYHCGPEWSYVDWHTGAFVPYLTETATTVPDIESAGLAVTLCAPLRRHAVNDPAGNQSFVYEESVYRPPWYLRGTRGRYVQIYRCGRRKPLRIHRCSARSSCWPQLGGGYLTWNELSPSWRGSMPVVSAFRLGDRRRIRIGTLKGHQTVWHTSRTIYVNGASWKRVYAAPLPRRSTGGKP